MSSAVVDQKLLNKHRVLPLVKRGKRLFLGISDPTNLQAIDEIKFQTGLRVDPVVVEQDKLEERITKAIEAVDTTMDGLDDDDFDLENLDVTVATRITRTTSHATTSKTRRWCASSTRSCSTRSSAARRTSTSNPTRNSSASAPGSTAC